MAGKMDGLDEAGSLFCDEPLPELPDLDVSPILSRHALMLDVVDTCRSSNNLIIYL
jgi:hypothetical protein